MSLEEVPNFQPSFTHARQSVLARDDVSPEVRDTALAMIDRDESEQVARRKAGIAILDLTAHETFAQGSVDPSALTPATLASFSVEAERLGDEERRVRYREVALNSSLLRDILAAMPTRQAAALREMAARLPPSGEIPSAVGERAVEPGDSALERLKADLAAGHDPEAVGGEILATARAFAASGRAAPAKELARMFRSAVGMAEEREPDTSQRAAIVQAILSDLDRAVRHGEGMAGRAATFDVLRQAVARQQASFADDAFAAGATLYPELGPPAPVDWSQPPEKLVPSFVQRAHQAIRISERREGAPVIPFTQKEIATLRDQLDQFPPERQAPLLQALARLPGGFVAGVAQAIAGPESMGDAQSNALAAALSFFAQGTSASARVAGQVLRGARLLRDGVRGHQAAVMTSPEALELIETMGVTAAETRDLSPAIADTIEALYLYRMHSAGRAGSTVNLATLRLVVQNILGLSPLRSLQSQ